MANGVQEEQSGRSVATKSTSFFHLKKSAIESFDGA